ncbi:hypothetical protein DJ017_08405 [Phenylobacterium soli]|uniref:Uncharacterized protein n=2 Tax=Phenylobacterium soli TaxID=2170551 RepID=A0A328AJ55_9CAUL|nr:hypothetical protein DJ017_08405 [Phenylobacterium soli]
MAGLALAGCAAVARPPPLLAAAPPPPLPPPAAPREVIVRVPTPVRSACVPRNLPPPPKYPDTPAALRAAGGAADRYQLIAAGRILRAKRLALLERVIEGCR